MHQQHAADWEEVTHAKINNKVVQYSKKFIPLVRQRTAMATDVWPATTNLEHDYSEQLPGLYVLVDINSRFNNSV